jgi:hypothetical protein
MAEALLVTRNDIVKFTALNGNVDTDNFIQWVKVAQDIHIQNYLGTDLIERIKTDIINEDLSGELFKLSCYVCKTDAYTFCNDGILTFCGLYNSEQRGV